MTTTQQITTVVQATVTTLQLRQHIAEIRRDVGNGMYVVTSGRYSRKPAWWRTYHDAHGDAVARIESMVAAEQHAEETSCDGLCPEMTL